MPLKRTFTLADLNDESQPKENHLLSLSPPDSLDVRKKDKERAISILVKPYTTICPSIFNLKPPIMTISSPPTPRQSSPLSPCQNLHPGRPVFPPSKKKANLYRQAIKKSAQQAQAHQAKRHICMMELERKNLGGLNYPVEPHWH
jgi:hypothetical protein